jgi:hypothetical protein
MVVAVSLVTFVGAGNNATGQTVGQLAGQALPSNTPLSSAPLSLPFFVTPAAQQQQQQQQLNLQLNLAAAAVGGGCCAAPAQAPDPSVPTPKARKTAKVRRHTSAARIPKPQGAEEDTPLTTSVEGRPSPGEIAA